jgi:uncharacterized protein (DUF2236 family)
MPTPLDLVARPLKAAIAGQVVAMFNDRSRAETPVQKSADALFGPGSAMWRVHGDVTTMMVGGMASLLLQMLHPSALAGVWDHSNFRNDMSGRLRRTARFIAMTTYGPAADAEAAIARVRRIHDAVSGHLPDGTHYRASDPRLLAWVHVTEASSFLAGWLRYGDPAMPGDQQDRYFAEIARIGRALGADPVPESRREARRLIESMRPELRYDARTAEMAALLMATPAASAAAEPVQALARQAAIDLLPGWAQRLHGFRASGVARPLVRAGTRGVAQTLRWAFR